MTAVSQIMIKELTVQDWESRRLILFIVMTFDVGQNSH